MSDNHSSEKPAPCRESSCWMGFLCIACVIVTHVHSMDGGSCLWPYTDAVEFASMATSLATGEGPTLRIGPAWYPARLPPTTSLLLLPQALLGCHFSSYSFSIMLCGILAGILMWRLAHACGLKASGTLAAAVALVCCPGFARYSGWVLGDVPALACLIGMLLAATLPEKRPEITGRCFAVLCLLGAIHVTFRTTNVIWPALLLALFLARRWRDLRRTPLWLAAGAVGLALPLLALAAYHWRVFSHPLRTGYHYWIGDLATAAGATFHPSFAFASEATPGHPGNLLYYAKLLTGIDSTLYPLPFALFGITGIILAWRRRKESPAFRTFFLPVLGALLATFIILSLYRWHSPRLMLPAVLLAALGVGICLDEIARKFSNSAWFGPWAWADIATVLLLVVCSLFFAPGEKERAAIANWRKAIAAEQIRANAAPPGAILETDLPLAMASLLAPQKIIFRPSGKNTGVHEYHLEVIRQDNLPPQRLDPAHAPLWREILEPN